MIKNNKFYYILKTFKKHYSEMYIVCKYGQILERKRVDKDFTYFIQMTNLLNNVAKERPPVIIGGI